MSTARSVFAALLVGSLALACSAAKHDMSMAHHQHLPDSVMAMPVNIPPGAMFSVDEVRFMQGMIAHHAQAIYMSRLAEAHGANPRLLRLAKKIDQSQISEIALMQNWLHDKKQFVPDTSSHRSMSMPGMLTPAQLAKLEASRGAEFDRQFLQLMIQHHEGALKMVADLMANPRASQDVDVSVFATDVEVGQTAEIALMHQMLADL